MGGKCGATVRPESFASTRTAQAPDPAVIQQIESLQAENRELRVSAKRRQAAAFRYIAQIDQLILEGVPRAKAVLRVLRENPLGRVEFLARTDVSFHGERRVNSRALVESQLVNQPLNSGDESDMARARLFEKKVAVEMGRTHDRRRAIQNTGRAYPQLHSAWCRHKTSLYAGWHDDRID